jgi:hypothetical protein
MMAERPPADGHRRTILDPESTHVGVGWALGEGRFQMAEEFVTRTLERLTVSLRDPARLVLTFEGRVVQDQRLEFVTIAREPPPSPLTREQASGRSNYSYPRPGLAYVGEGTTGMRVSGVYTQARIGTNPTGSSLSSSCRTSPASTPSSYRRPASSDRPGRGARSPSGWSEVRGFVIGDFVICDWGG